MNEKQVGQFLSIAGLSSDERHEILRRFGPAMLDTQELSSFVPPYYSDPGTSKGFSLLCNLLDKHPDDNTANQMLASTLLDDVEVRMFFSRYGKSHPPFCYRLPAACRLRKKLDWREVQQYVPAWLDSDMPGPELEEVLGDAPPEAFDGSLLEVYGQRYLTRSPRSTALLKLTRHYLQAYDAGVFRRKRGPHFLRFLYENEKKYLPADFADLKEIIDDYYNILLFIERPSLQQDQLLAVFRIIHQKVPFGEKLSWVELLARALVTCINQRSYLGFAHSSINMSIKDDAVRCLLDMVDHIKVQVSTSNNELWWRRAAILLESALLPDLSVTFSEEVRQEVINKLLSGASSGLLSYVDEQTASWSPDIQQRWRKVAQPYGLVSGHRSSRPRKSVPLPVPPRSPELSPVPPTSPTTMATSSEQSAAQVSIKATPFVRLVRSVHGWLLFPWLLFRLWQLCRGRGRGTGKLARFWLDHSNALIASAGLTPHALKLHLKFACDFHNTCQDAHDSPTPKDAYRRLLSVTSVQKNQVYLPTLTNHEILLVLQAARYTGIDASPHLPSFTVKSGWWPRFRGWLFVEPLPAMPDQQQESTDDAAAPQSNLDQQSVSSGIGKNLSGTNKRQEKKRGKK